MISLGTFKRFMLEEGVPTMTLCPSCYGRRTVSPMVIFWKGDLDAPCVECHGTGDVEVCPTCKGEGDREPDPGESPPAIGKLRCRKCKGWGTLGDPPTTLRQLGIPPELRWLGVQDKQGRMIIAGPDELPISESLFLVARSVHMGLRTRENADENYPGWVHHLEHVEATFTPIVEPRPPRVNVLTRFLKWLLTKLGA